MTTAAAAGKAPPAVPADVSARALEILQRSVSFPTFAGQDKVPAYAAYLAEVLEAGGFAREDITITPFEETAFLIARYRGSNPDAKPIVLAFTGDEETLQATTAVLSKQLSNAEIYLNSDAGGANRSSMACRLPRRPTWTSR